MRLREQAHELRLGPVRVLELVDEDVPEAPGDRRPGRRRLADEPQGERHLVAEVDEPVRRQQVLVSSEGARQLRLPAGILRQRGGAIASGSPPAAAARAAASAATRSAWAA